MGGAPGVGKTYFRTHLQSICPQCLPEVDHENAIIISPDIVRPLLPEYGLYDVEIQKEKEQQIELLGKEVGLICELLLWTAIEGQSTKHIVFDSSLRHTEWFKWLMETIRDEYPSRKMAMVGLLPQSMDQLKQQVLKRNVENDRYTEWTFVKRVAGDIERSLFELKPLVDVAVNVTNPGISMDSVDVLKQFPIRVHFKESMDGDGVGKEVELTLYDISRKKKSLLSIGESIDSEQNLKVVVGVMVAIIGAAVHLLTVRDH